jgi:5'-deoxynucleotidase YfbR-like HD superfamily hydrolase
MNDKEQDNTFDSLFALGRLSLLFATVNRVTYLADGKSPESDTDHTVMLGLLACAFAAASDPSLDIGKIAQFSLVHDLVEAYAGDTNTFGMTEEVQKADKNQREAEALTRIKSEFDATLPWISKTIQEYESLESAEAKFVKTMDKCLPKITRLANNDANETRPEVFDEFCKKQIKILRESYGKDHELLCEFYEYLHQKTFFMLKDKHG